MNDRSVYFPFKVVIPLLLAGIALVAAVVISARIGTEIAEESTPLQDASMQIKYELSLFHLWFEEMAKGDRTHDDTEIWSHLERARWYANAMLEGASDWEGTYVPIEDPELRRELYEALDDMDRLDKSAGERKANLESGGVDADLDFDAVFLRALERADDIERKLHAVMKSRIFRFKAITGGLMVGSALLVIVMAVVLAGYERKRMEHVHSLKEANDMLEKSGRDLAVTLASIGDGVIIADAAGRIISMNPIAEGMTGWSTEEARGHEFAEVFDIINEKTGEKAENPAYRVLDEGVIVGLANHTMLISKDGTRRPIDDSCAPIKYEDGSMYGVVLVFRDVTERKKAEEEKNRLVRAIANSTEGIAFTDGDDRFVYVNDAFAKNLGYGTDEMKGFSWNELVLPEGRELFESALKHTLYNPEVGVFSGECAALRKDGTTMPAEIRVRAIWGHETRYEGHVCVMRDITDRKLAEKQREDLYAMLRHDMKTPLSIISGNAEMVLKDFGDMMDPQARSMVDAIDRSVTNLSAMIDDLVTVSRLESEGVALNSKPGDLEEVIADVSLTISPKAKELGLEFGVKVQEGIPKLPMDKGYVQRAVDNLLVNALKYTPAGGRVSLAAGAADMPDGSFAYVSVSDTGPGISPEEHEKIFEKNYRSPRAAKVKGSGLGLAIVKAVAKAHGGRVEVKSAEGEGSTFTLYLPVLKQ